MHPSRRFLTAATIVTILLGAAGGQPAAAGNDDQRFVSPVSWTGSGVPVLGPRDVKGKKVTKVKRATLDSCAGHSHRIRIDRRWTRRYHYHRIKGTRVGCPQEPAPASHPVEPASRISIETDPALFPSFDPEVTDYATRCTGDPVNVEVSAENLSVSVDGSEPRTGEFEQTAAVTGSQGFSVDSSSGRDYHVRCVPADFPAWNYDRLADPHRPYYVVTPTGSRYVVIFDDHGAPVWWMQNASSVGDAKVLSDGTIAWGRSGLPRGYELRSPDGALERFASYSGAVTDTHDLQEVGNGNLLLMSYVPREHVDLSLYGGSADGTVTDAGIQEIDPDGNVV